MGDAYFFSFGGCAAYKCTKTFLYGEENGARQVFFPVRKHTPLAGKVQVLSEDEVPPVKAVPAPVPEQQNENNGRQAPTLLKGSFGLLAIGRVFPWPPMGAMAGFALRSHENNEPAAPLSQGRGFFFFLLRNVRPWAQPRSNSADPNFPGWFLLLLKNHVHHTKLVQEHVFFVIF
jgi:hypothetical protein